MRYNKIRIADIENVRKALDQAPKKEDDEVGKREAIRLLMGSIQAAQKKGYGMEAIADILSKNGITVSTGLLRGYLSHVRKSATTGRRKRVRASGSARGPSRDVNAGGVDTHAHAVGSDLVETRDQPLVHASVADAGNAGVLPEAVNPAVDEATVGTPAATPVEAMDSKGSQSPAAIEAVRTQRAKHTRDAPAHAQQGVRDPTTAKEPSASRGTPGGRQPNIPTAPGEAKAVVHAEAPAGSGPGAKRSSTFVPRKDSDDI